MLLFQAHNPSGCIGYHLLKMFAIVTHTHTHTHMHTRTRTCYLQSTRKQALFCLGVTSLCCNPLPHPPHAISVAKQQATNVSGDEHNASVYPPPIPRRITYWLQFLESHHVPGTTAPHVIIIGSHKDILKRQQPESYKTKVSAIESFVKGKVMSDTSLHFAGFFAVDCR